MSSNNQKQSTTQRMIQGQWCVFLLFGIFSIRAFHVQDWFSRRHGYRFREILWQFRGLKCLYCVADQVNAVNHPEVGIYQQIIAPRPAVTGHCHAVLHSVPFLIWLRLFKCLLQIYPAGYLIYLITDRVTSYRHRGLRILLKRLLSLYTFLITMYLFA